MTNNYLKMYTNKNTYCETGSLGPFSNGICTDLYCIAL